MKRKGNPIGWCTDTWNPVVGCSKISPGCAHCYAETMAKRLAAMGQEKYAATTGFFRDGNTWNGKCFLSESELEKPFHWKKPRRIFVSSMGDLFHENVPFEWIDRVMSVIAMNTRHKFMILTKRPEKMEKYFNFEMKAECEYINESRWSWLLEKHYENGGDSVDFPGWPFPNLALGVTAETQEMADLRIPILLRIPAALRFVSIEPMLGPVDLIDREFPITDGGTFFGKKCKIIGRLADGMDFLSGETWQNSSINGGGRYGLEKGEFEGPHLDWVILGMETGPGARTFPGAAGAIVNVKDQCVAAGVPFFYKGPQHVSSGVFSGKKLYHMGYWGTKKEKEHIIENIEYRQFPEGI